MKRASDFRLMTLLLLVLMIFALPICGNGGGDDRLRCVEMPKIHDDSDLVILDMPKIYDDSDLLFPDLVRDEPLIDMGKRVTPLDVGVEDWRDVDFPVVLPNGDVTVVCEDVVERIRRPG